MMGWAGFLRGCRFVVDEVAEWLVLAAVLGIAAVASYLHLRDVWRHAGAPIPDFGPLLVDGLFAAAWLRMRRRRRDDISVGGLAWFALGLALVATVAGNIAAAVIAGHTSPLAIAVAAWPALAFALVWELVTGHARPASRAERAASKQEATAPASVEPPQPAPLPETVGVSAAPDPQLAVRESVPAAGEDPEERRRRLNRERAQRARRHSSGDHSLCDPTKCAGARVRVVS